MSRWSEIFEDEKGKRSGTKVTMLYGVLIGSILLFMMVIYTGGKPDPWCFGTFCAMCGGVYGVGKMSSDSVAKAAMNPDPTDPQPTKIDGPKTEINIGDGKVKRKK